MKKSIKSIVFLLCVSFFVLGGCQSKEEQKTDVFTDNSQTVLDHIMQETDLEMGMTFDDAINQENCESTLGIKAEEFDAYVTDAHVSTAAITTVAHLAAVVKCKDFDSAMTVKDLIANGFDSGRWICVFPEESFVVESGSYVFLVSSTAESAKALKEGFEKVAGDTYGETNVFYTDENK